MLKKKGIFLKKKRELKMAVRTSRKKTSKKKPSKKFSKKKTATKKKTMTKKKVKRSNKGHPKGVTPPHLKKWLAHLNKYAKEHGLKLGDAMKPASLTYNKKN